MAAKEFGVIFRVEGRAPMNPEKNLKKRKGTNEKLFLHVSSDKLGSFCFS